MIKTKKEKLLVGGGGGGGGGGFFFFFFFFCHFAITLAILTILMMWREALSLTSVCICYSESSSFPFPSFIFLGYNWEVQALFSSQNFSRFPVTSNLAAHAWSIKYIWKQKLFAQFICKPRDEFFEPSYSIIGQCLSNKNESATVSFFTGFCQLNKASAKDHMNNDFIFLGSNWEVQQTTTWTMTVKWFLPLCDNIGDSNVSNDVTWGTLTDICLHMLLWIKFFSLSLFQFFSDTIGRFSKRSHEQWLHFSRIQLGGSANNHMNNDCQVEYVSRWPYLCISEFVTFCSNICQCRHRLPNANYFW